VNLRDVLVLIIRLFRATFKLIMDCRGLA